MSLIFRNEKSPIGGYITWRKSIIFMLFLGSALEKVPSQHRRGSRMHTWFILSKGALFSLHLSCRKQTKSHI